MVAGTPGENEVSVQRGKQSLGNRAPAGAVLCLPGPSGLLTLKCSLRAAGLASKLRAWVLYSRSSCLASSAVYSQHPRAQFWLQ